MTAPALPLPASSFRTGMETDTLSPGPFYRSLTDWIDLLCEGYSCHASMYAAAAARIGEVIGRDVDSGEDLDCLVERYAISQAQLCDIWCELCGSTPISGDSSQANSRRLER